MAAHTSADPVYTIGVVSDLTDMHEQTIRLYERLGLVKPERRGKNRLYSENEVERLRQIRRFTQEMGVNLAGVEIILTLLSRLEDAQRERDEFRERAEQLEFHFRDFVARTGREFP